MFRQVICLVRYRFFIFAGLFPYILGQAIAFNLSHSLNWQRFFLGFLGISLVLIGVELFNEYFDAESGGDRVFSLERHEISRYFYWLGLLVFAVAFMIGIILTLQAGYMIALFSFVGFLAAYFYVGPPLKLAYRGWGETVIAFSYGPAMLLGSFYLQRQKIESPAVFVSLICALALFSLAIVNEIPDYYQDRLVGKRNLVVRLGQKKALELLALSLTVLFFLLTGAIIFKKVPFLVTVVFLFLPKLYKSLKTARSGYDNPTVFMGMINTNIVIYLAIAFSLIIGYLI